MNDSEEIIKIKCKLDEHDKRIEKNEGDIKDIVKQQNEQGLLLNNINNKSISIEEKVTKLYNVYEDGLKEDSNDKKEFFKRAFYFSLATIGGILLGYFGLR